MGIPLAREGLQFVQNRWFRLRELGQPILVNIEDPAYTTIKPVKELVVGSEYPPIYQSDSRLSGT